MEICDFAHHRPATVGEACDLGRRFGGAARFLAGGTELLVDLKQRRYTIEHVIALDGLTALRELRTDAEGLHIGPLVTLEELSEAAEVRVVFPVLADAMRTMAAVQIRNRATIGGNFCAAVPCADAPPACIVGGAHLRIVGPDGERSLPVEAFFVGPRSTALRPGELLVEIRIPHQPAGSGASYQRFARRKANTLATAGVAASVVLADGRITAARVALSAVAPTPLLAVETGALLVGQPATDELFARAGRLAASEARPIDDFRASAEFRRSLVATLTERALREAVSRARGDGRGPTAG